MALADDRFKVIEETVILVGLVNVPPAPPTLLTRSKDENVDQPPLPTDDLMVDTDFN